MEPSHSSSDAGAEVTRNSPRRRTGANEPDPIGDDTTPAPERTDQSAPDPSGEYRLRDGVGLADDILVSKRPLTATRLNDAAVHVVDALGRESAFRAPEAIAQETGTRPSSIRTLCERLHQRGFLEWRPARDPTHTPPVSVVVTVRNDREHLRACLDALAELAYPTYEVVVVDDGSTDGTPDAAVNHRLADERRIRVVSVGTADEPLGIGASRNRGVEVTAYGVVAFTDADCRPRPSWLADLVPHLAAHDLVGGRIRPAGDGPASVYEGHNSSLDMGPRASRVDPGGETPYLATANLVGRRAVFEAVPFPERNVAEDVAVCWGALEAGFDVVYTPDGVVEHVYRTGVRSFARRRTAYGASEALLAREQGREGMDSVEISAIGLTVVVLASAGMAATVAAPLPDWLTAAVVGVGIALAGVGAIAGGAARWRQFRRLSPAITPGDVVESWARGRLSSAYALARELTRYYTGPLVTLGGVGVFAGATGVINGAEVGGAILLCAVAVAMTLPLGVEYRVSNPETSVLAYSTYYLADHLGYQRGVYRGAVEHRTLSHLRPTARFRLSGIGVKALRRLRAARSP
ncbi:glycosyltransferase [Halobellus sp. H-GB7]|uniref:glycosyltransferase n=1 Tax=Halobellus sp. H-GB7 TaxID=3069756 RepID=UPI0027B3CEA5|nr:glycosyltransferase [Halobellus sp. H-GB7]MDQ2054557.1 glycosyltransferase [Halobellus sp. H-GB7]